MTVWIRFPELPVEYYDKQALFEIAKVVGTPIRVDYATDNLTRARYARVCLDLDLSKSLVTSVWVVSQWQRVEYENIHSLCFTCGKIGHSKEKCGSALSASQDKIHADHSPKATSSSTTQTYSSTTHADHSPHDTSPPTTQTLNLQTTFPKQTTHATTHREFASAEQFEAKGDYGPWTENKWSLLEKEDLESKMTEECEELNLGRTNASHLKEILCVFPCINPSPSKSQHPTTELQVAYSTMVDAGTQLPAIPSSSTSSQDLLLNEKLSNFSNHFPGNQNKEKNPQRKVSNGKSESLSTKEKISSTSINSNQPERRSSSTQPPLSTNQFAITPIPPCTTITNPSISTTPQCSHSTSSLVPPLSPTIESTTIQKHSIIPPLP
ncbi:uncharacterized protein [Spinacia oleracea]|uniref:CCHC-type domain-containing protein n=1 Tax=Spinacia oleracea TaxID=3562 RepID=A0ABM3RRD6_SPIOL|nr:uncharacterized protein LOC130471867 [Spinacia oleracea]